MGKAISDDDLIAWAKQVRKKAYAPFSNFFVGSAILGADGEPYLGANVENSSYGLTICAERSAATAAVSAGCTKFEAIAIASAGGHAPCGACRQFLNEFTDGSLRVLLVDADEAKAPKVLPLAELLPRSFRLGDA